MQNDTTIMLIQIRQKGLSLIELMIAIVLGLVITAGMIQLFVNSKQSYRVQENLSRLQENGRFAMDFISRDLRMADYWGCLNSPALIDNNLNTPSVYDNFENAIDGTNNDGLNGSDSIAIGGAKASNVFVVSHAGASADLQVTNDNGLAENDIVIVSDCVAGDIFQITNDDPSSSNTLAHSIDAVSDGPGNQDPDFQKTYSTDAQIYKLRSVRYLISTGASGQPALFRSTNAAPIEELVEGIENMQILYGIDTDGDNTANYYTSSDSLTLIQMSDVKSIKISLLATTLDDNLATQPVPYTIFATTTTPTDHKIRRVFTSIIALRNRLLPAGGP